MASRESKYSGTVNVMVSMVSRESKYSGTVYGIPSPPMISWGTTQSQQKLSFKNYMSNKIHFFVLFRTVSD